MTWVPSTNDPQVPTFYLNKGTTTDFTAHNWDDDTNLMYLSSDVCRGMVLDKYASTHLFTITGYCGKLDGSCVSDVGNVLISLGDPVGYLAVEVIFGNGHEGLGGNKAVATAFIEQKGINKGACIFFNDTFPVEMHESGNNAILRAKNEDVCIETVEDKSFEDFSRKLCDMDPNTLSGMILKRLKYASNSR